MNNYGNLFIFSAPSGAGKTSLIKALDKKVPNLHFSVSHTTRPMRPGEKDGVDYHFISEEEFFKLKESGEFLESAKVFDNYYGTSESWVEKSLAEGKDIALEIDWQGARQIHDRLPDSIKIFILPPSQDILLQRLVDRAQDTDDVINHRMSKALEEIEHFVEYDYLIVNDDFDKTVLELESIIKACRSRYVVQVKNLQKLLNELLQKRA